MSKLTDFSSKNFQNPLIFRLVVIVGRMLSIRTVRMVRTDILAMSQRASHSPGQAGDEEFVPARH